MTSNNELNEKSILEVDEINYGEIIKFFLRNKILISLSSLFFFIAGCLYALSIKPTWQGSFQIVLSNQKKEGGGLKALFAGIDVPLSKSIKGVTDKYTELEVIKSPSILMPIFLYVKEYQGKNSRLTFNKWRSEYLDISNIKKTTVVNLSYKDKNKDIILPVLNKISDAYQDYSGKERRNQLDSSIVFLNDQIEIYAKKSLDSSTKAKDFAVKYNLSFLNDENNSDLKGISNVSRSIPSPLANIEVRRLKAADSIEILETQIRQINNLEDTQAIFSYISSMKEKPIEVVSNIQEEFTTLSLMRSVFLENDRDITIQKEKIKSQINQLKTYMLSLLENSLLKAKEEFKSTKRPVEVISKYKELKTKSELDLKTLSSLKTDLRLNIIERAKASQPWELISNPTLMDYPVAPQKKIVALISLLIGFISSSFILYLKELRKDIIFDKKKLESILGYEMLLDLEKNDSKKTDNDMQSIINFLNEDKETGFIKLGDIKDQDINYFKKYFEDNNESIDDRFNQNDYKDKFKSYILLLSLGSIKKKEILDFKQRCNLNPLEIKGFFNLT